MFFELSKVGGDIRHDTVWVSRDNSVPPSGFRAFLTMLYPSLVYRTSGVQVLFNDKGVAWGIKATLDGVPQARN